MILVLGGTSDARDLAAELRRAGYKVLLSVVSEYGARLAQVDASGVRSGALDETTLEPLLDEVQAVVDATHPFAEQISALAAAACGRRGQPYLRYERPSTKLPAGVIRAADAATAARLAVSHAHSGPILLTVGSKTVATYVAAARAAGVRVVARVLPTPASLQACTDAGLEPADIIAMQGPSSVALDEALLRHLGATVLVMKDSGEAGGVSAKLAAAERAAATAIVVMRPKSAGAGEPALPTATPADV
ncbi:MAG: precorrin-6A reductase, partial [Thermoleophilia bacterium]